jgi:hypothetical protein
MRNWKIALAAAVLVTPLGSLNAGTPSQSALDAEALAAPQAGSFTESEGQTWGCCWIFFMGRWICLPC